jgi:hypothetical protein
VVWAAAAADTSAANKSKARFFIGISGGEFGRIIARDTEQRSVVSETVLFVRAFFRLAAQVSFSLISDLCFGPCQAPTGGSKTPAVRGIQ